MFNYYENGGKINCWDTVMLKLNVFQSNGNYPTFFEPGFNTCKYPHDERLAVIDEVDEKDNDCMSMASTEFDSRYVRSVSEDEWTRHTGKYT